MSTLMCGCSSAPKTTQLPILPTGSLTEASPAAISFVHTLAYIAVGFFLIAVLIFAAYKTIKRILGDVATSNNRGVGVLSDQTHTITKEEKMKIPLNIEAEVSENEGLRLWSKGLPMTMQRAGKVVVTYMEEKDIDLNPHAAKIEVGASNQKKA